MTDELKTALNELQALIRDWNIKKIPNEEEFIDKLRPVVLKVKEEIEKPKKEQTKIGEQGKVSDINFDSKIDLVRLECDF